eukprot:6749201-Ditylum_brightwellii.AAC.1
MSECVVNSKQEEAMDLTNSIDFKKHCYGATYVPLETAIHMQTMVSKCDNVQVVIDDRRDCNGDRLP